MFTTQANRFVLQVSDVLKPALLAWSEREREREREREKERERETEREREKENNTLLHKDKDLSTSRLFCVFLQICP